MFPWRDVSGSLCVTRLRPAKTAERTSVLFWVETLGGSRNIVLDGGSRSPAVMGGKFDATFAKLLWPLVYICNCYGENLFRTNFKHI